jgi:hypothetical protein
MRVGETIKAFVAKLRGDLSGVRELRMAKLNRGDRRLCLLPWEDLLPPAVIGGGDPTAATKALVDRGTAVQWPNRKAVHQVGARSAASPSPSPRSKPSKVHHAAAPKPRTSPFARRGRMNRHSQTR